MSDFPNTNNDRMVTVTLPSNESFLRDCAQSMRVYRRNTLLFVVLCVSSAMSGFGIHHDVATMLCGACAGFWLARVIHEFGQWRGIEKVIEHTKKRGTP